MGKRRKITSALLATGVTLGALGLGATPALAQKNAKTAAAPAGLKLAPSKAFLPLGAAAQKAVEAAKADPAAAPAALAAIDAAFAGATTADTGSSRDRWRRSARRQLRIKALQRRACRRWSIRTRRRRTTRSTISHFLAGLQRKDYSGAQAAAQAAINGGYSADEAVGILSEAYFSQNQYAQGLAALKQAAAAKRRRRPAHSGKLAQARDQRRLQEQAHYRGDRMVDNAARAVSDAA